MVFVDEERFSEMRSRKRLTSVFEKPTSGSHEKKLLKYSGIWLVTMTKGEYKEKLFYFIFYGKLSCLVKSFAYI